jgi:hypothetical protein
LTSEFFLPAPDFNILNIRREWWRRGELIMLILFNFRLGESFVVMETIQKENAGEQP